MFSNSENGVIEVWLDGEKIYIYTGNVNNGTDFNDFYLQSTDEETSFSNVIISNYPIGLNENIVSIDFDVQFDTLRHIVASFDCSFT